jgi:hypothetical protein
VPHPPNHKAPVSRPDKAVARARLPAIIGGEGGRPHVQQSRPNNLGIAEVICFPFAAFIDDEAVFVGFQT